MAITNISPGNGVTDIGGSASPWLNGYFTNLFKGGVAVPLTTDARFPTADEKAALAGSSGTPSASNKFLTAEDKSRVWFLESVVGLTGGGSTKLDGYSTSGVTVGLTVSLVDANGGSPIYRAYQLTSATTAESSPTVIRPDDYATTTNEKVWKLVSSATDADTLAVAFNPANYTETGTTLAGHLEGIDDKLAEVLDTRSGIYREINLPADLFRSNTGTPTISDITLGSIKLKAVTFADAATNSILVAFQLPDLWDTAENPRFRLVWSSATTGGDVAFSITGNLFDSGDDLTAALGTAHTFNQTAEAVDSLAISASFSLTLAGSGRLCVINVARTGSAGGDTLAGTVRLHAVQVQYKESATEPTAWT
jgi:hypothetical protein